MKNNQEVQLEGREILDKKVLVLGEVGSGKTELVAKLLEEIMVLRSPEKITVIDFAPQRIGEVGGKITEFLNIPSVVKYLSPENVYTPRIAGSSPEQILHYAELNRKNMEPLLNEFIHNATEILVLNDTTLYLHMGKLETVLKCVELARTFLATAYYGSKLAKDLGTGISLKERQSTDKLATFMDFIVKINSLRKIVDVHTFSPYKPDEG